MNTISKIALAFILGIVCALWVLNILRNKQNTEENQLREEIRTQALKNLKQSLDGNNEDETTEINIQSFELTTKNGIVKLHTYMPKDSVQAIMGRPQSTDIHNNKYIDQVRETWKYRGSNRYIDEFTIEFINGELESVRQYKDH
jgi:hypothetical protein